MAGLVPRAAALSAHYRNPVFGAFFHATPGRQVRRALTCDL